LKPQLFQIDEFGDVGRERGEAIVVKLENDERGEEIEESIREGGQFVVLEVELCQLHTAKNK
jgi:hypothetical protein